MVKGRLAVRPGGFAEIPFVFGVSYLIEYTFAL